MGKGESPAFSTVLFLGAETLQGLDMCVCVLEKYLQFISRYALEVESLGEGSLLNTMALFTHNKKTSLLLWKHVLELGACTLPPEVEINHFIILSKPHVDSSR